jgi:hypothetical protein
MDIFATAGAFALVFSLLGSYSPFSPRPLHHAKRSPRNSGVGFSCGLNEDYSCQIIPTEMSGMAIGPQEEAWSFSFSYDL